MLNLLESNIVSFCSPQAAAGSDAGRGGGEAVAAPEAEAAAAAAGSDAGRGGASGGGDVRLLSHLPASSHPSLSLS